MLFNSIEFLVFFPIVTILYYLLPHRFRWGWLLAASCYFYISFIPIYILILALTIVVDYSAGILIEKTNGRRRRFYLVSSIIVTCLILFIFKYFNFFNANIDALAHALHWNYSIGALKLILPIGLSFHTFQSMAYVIEVYRGNQKAEKNFGIYSLYVMFYPQLVAGPIERPQNLLHQFHEEHTFNGELVSSGLRLMIWGFIKKVVFADRLAIYVNEVYSGNHLYHGWPILFAMIFFSFQIYCDFSGYSDIAIGAARVMGFKLMINFNYPYISKSVAEFWRRWHISLSTWFKDYLYIPLGGNKVSKVRWRFNIFLTFIISGLWHGAAWTFLIWGVLHGLALIIENGLHKHVQKLKSLFSLKLLNTVSFGITFAFICITWVFFRAKSYEQAIYMIKNVFPLGKFRLMFINGKVSFLATLLCIVALEGLGYLNRKSNLQLIIDKQKTWIKWSLYYFAIFFILQFGIFENTQFIYFQF